MTLNEIFGEGFEDFMEALKNLHQTGSVREYQAEFDSLLTGINLSNENAISCFLGCLKPEMDKAVRIQSPRTLLQASKIARLQEEVFESQAQSWGLKPYSQKPSFPNSTIQTSTFKKPYEPNSNKPNRFNNNNRRLTTAEMDEKKSKGLCFICDEKYVLGHNCRAKKQLYLVEVLEEESVVLNEKEQIHEMVIESVKWLYHCKHLLV